MTDNPLVKALREAREAAEKNPQLSVAEIEAYIEEETGTKLDLSDAVSARNVGRSAAQGALFNFGDEALGALPESMGGGEAAKEEMRLREVLFRRSHAIVDGAAGMVGGIASGLVVPGSAGVRGLSVGRAALRGATFGALEGGLSGAGSGEGGLGDRAGRAAGGAIAGAALGATAPAVAGGVKSAFSPAARAERRMAHKIARAGGEDKLRGRVRDFEAAGRGDEVMLADLHPELRSNLRYAAHNNDDVMTPAAEMLEARQEDMSERLLGDVRGLVGYHPSAGIRTEQLAESTRRFGDAGYSALRAANPNIDPALVKRELGPLLSQPLTQRALAKAQADGLVGTTPDLGMPSYAHLLDLKKALDGQVNEAYTKGNGTLGAGLAEVRDKVAAFLERHVADHKTVNDGYAAHKARETALELGQKAWSTKDVPALRAQVAALKADPQALSEFRYGLAAKLTEQLADATLSNDQARKIVKGGKAMQLKLEIVFDDPATFRSFMQRAKAERDMAVTNRVTGGSQTHSLKMDEGADALLEGAGAVMTGGAAGLMQATKQGAASLGRGALSRGTARELGTPMLMQGAKTLDEYLRNRAARPDLIGRAWTQAAPAALTSLFDFFPNE